MARLVIKRNNCCVILFILNMTVRNQSKIKVIIVIESTLMILLLFYLLILQYSLEVLIRANTGKELLRQRLPKNVDRPCLKDYKDTQRINRNYHKWISVLYGSIGTALRATVKFACVKS